MSVQFQLRRGTTAQINAITPAQGEILYDTTRKGLVAGDGATLGGATICYDYREGTFSPALQFGGAATGITYGTQVGSYTKIGNVIKFQFYIVLTNKGSSTGSATITGLPFTASSTSNDYAPLAGYESALGASIACVQRYVAPGSSVVTLRKFAAGTSSSMADTDFTNTSQIMVGGTYHI